MKGSFGHLIIIFLLSTQLVAQVNGIVKDANTGNVIDGAEVFINHSSWRSISNEEGSFNLTNVHPGFFELVVCKKGYEIFQSSMRIQKGKVYQLNLDLIPISRFKLVNSKKDDLWTAYFLQFKKVLLGINDLSDSYKIENTKSLQFKLSGKSLIAKSDDPLRIENKMLGLIMNVYVLYFEVNPTSTNFQAGVSYQLMDSDDRLQQSAFEINRLRSYWGSSRHFFQTLVTNTTESDGFVIYNTNNESIKPAELISKGRIEGYYIINVTDTIRVSYLTRPGNTSTLVSGKSIEVNEYGQPLSGKSLEISGVMRESGLANTLPINYFPAFSIPNGEVYWKNYYLLQEKIYLHTDRDYYYPRESIWFKGYMVYHDLALTDSLSKTLYVDLISPQRKIIDSRMYPIREGVAWGDFKLSDSLPSGQYCLRAYTNWMRNFGDSTFFVKAIPILSIDENIEWNDNEKENFRQSSAIKIESDQLFYKGRQKVELKLRAIDELTNPLKANLSISVTDCVEAVALSDNSIIESTWFEFPTLDDKATYFDQIRYMMEPGVTIHGIVKNARGIPIPANLEIVDGDDELVSLSTNSNGVFMTSGFDDMDSIVVAIMAYRKKNGRQVDSVYLLPREIPSVDLDLPSIPLKFRKYDALQRIQNTLQSDEAILLKEVVVQSTSLAKPEPNLQTLNYGNPDHTVKGDLVRFAGRNLLSGLKGRVPGLQVIEAQDGISIRLRGPKSLGGYSEPLILLDGTPLPDAESVTSIDPYTVDRVEIINRAVPLYGSRGAGGLIAIYTKKGIDFYSDGRKYVYKFPGYDKSNQFPAPDYGIANDRNSNPDFRTTIFWKPDLKTDAQGNAAVSFYTADLATRYRIVVEGVTEKGKPVREVYYITVE